MQLVNNNILNKPDSLYPLFLKGERTNLCDFPRAVLGISEIVLGAEDMLTVLFSLVSRILFGEGKIRSG